MTTEDQIITLLRTHGGLTAAQIIAKLGSKINPQTARGLLFKMSNAGDLEKHQETGSRHYTYRVAQKILQSNAPVMREYGVWHAHDINDQPPETFDRVVCLVTGDGTQLAARPANAVNWRTVGSKAPSEERRVAHYKVII